MAACEVSAVKNICAKLGEGPHWDTVTRKLLWVDSFDYKVHISDVETGVDKSYQLDGIVGSVQRIWDYIKTTPLADKFVYSHHLSAGQCITFVPRKRGGSVLVATQTSIIFLDLETGQKEVVATVDDDKPENHLNDGKCDSMGRFWVGSMGPEPEPTKVVPEQGTLFSFSGDRNLVKWVDKITISNGMTWSLDNKTFYYIDTATSKIDAFDYDEQGGSISNRRTAVKIDPLYGWPDGMTIDADGMLWVAMYDGWKVLCCNPSSGEIVRQVDLPVAKVTSCCWGGPNLDELFVTCESLRLSPEERKAQPLAGSVLRVKNLGTHGFPAVAFNG